MSWPGVFIVLEFAILSAGHNTNLDESTRAYSVYAHYVVRTMMSMLPPPPKTLPRPKWLAIAKKGWVGPGESNVRLSSHLSATYLRTSTGQRDRYHGVSMGDGDKDGDGDGGRETREPVSLSK